MNRTTLRSFIRRRIDDNLSGSGAVFSDTVINEEIDEAIQDVAGDVELNGAFWRLNKIQPITLAASVQSYPLNPDLFIVRKVVRTDVSPPIACIQIDRDDLEDFGQGYSNRSQRMRGSNTPNTEYSGGSPVNAFPYAIGPDDNGDLALLLPFNPDASAVLTVYYVRFANPILDDDDEPADIPKPLHRLVALKAAMNLLGPDQDGGGAWKAVAAEYGEMRERAMNLLGRTYTDEFVRNVEGL